MCSRRVGSVQCDILRAFVEFFPNCKNKTYLHISQFIYIYRIILNDVVRFTALLDLVLQMLIASSFVSKSYSVTTNKGHRFKAEIKLDLLV